MSARAKQTIGCLVLTLAGLALIAAGLIAGFSVDWNLLDTVIHQVGWLTRAAPSIFIVPALLSLGLLATAIGVVVIRLPAEDPRDER